MNEGDPGRSLVLCVGNDLVADDAVGCHVHERLQVENLPPGTRTKFLGLGGLSILDHLDGEENLVLVDAVCLGAPVGTIHVLAWDALPNVQATAVSVHGIGLREAIEVGKRLMPEAMPRRVMLVGVEGRCFDLVGHPLTAEVAAAVGPAAMEVVRCLERLRDTGFAGEQAIQAATIHTASITAQAQGAS